MSLKLKMGEDKLSSIKPDALIDGDHPEIFQIAKAVEEASEQDFPIGAASIPLYLAYI